MKGIVKALIAGGVIICIGVILLIVALSINGWKLKGKVDFEMTTYECYSENTNLNIEIDAGSVKTEFYDGDKIVIEYPIADGFKSLASEANGTLTFKAPKKKWYKYWFLSYDIPDSVIKLPKGTAYNVKFKINAGSVYLADETYGNVEIDIDAGTFNGGNITCNALKVNIDAGTVKLASAVCKTFNCDIDAGTVKVDSLTAQSTNVDVDAGTVDLLFTGNKEDYTITTRVKAGTCNLSNGTSADPNAKTIHVDVSAGKISAGFLG